MQKKLVVLFSLLFMAANTGFASSGEEVFLSLTRYKKSLNTLPTNISIITENDIKGSKTSNIGELIRKETGLNTSVNGSIGAESTAMFRGNSSAQTLVLLDGRKLNGISLGSADLSSIPLDNIERIEIVRGPASAIYGTNAMGGVINIITKRPAPMTKEAQLGLATGPFGEQSFSGNAEIGGEKVSSIFAASAINSDGYRKNSDFRANNVSVNSDLMMKNSILGVSASLYSNELGVPGAAYDLNGKVLTVSNYDGKLEKTASSPEARQKIERNYLRVDYERSLGINSLKTFAYLSNDLMKYKDLGGFFASNDEYNSSIYGAEIQYLIKEHNAFIGVEAMDETHKQDDKITNSPVMDKKRQNGALFAQKEIKANMLTLIPSLRYDSNSAFGNVFSPSLLMVYSLSKELKLSANTGRSWRAPTFNDLYSPWGGDKDIKPEYSISYDAGVSYAKNTWNCSLTGFYSDCEDLIVYDFITSQTKNLKNTYQTGTEMQFTQKISKVFEHQVNYTYLYTQDKDLKEEINYRPRNRANYTIHIIPLDRTRISLGALYCGAQKTGNVSFPELEGYTLFDLMAKQKIKNIELWGKAENLTDVKYQTRLGYPLPGVTYSAGVNISF